MKRNLFLLVILFAFTNAFSQKAKFKNEKFELAFSQPEIFKNFETFSYEIQDDGVYWNHKYDEDEKKPDSFKDYPTLRSLTQGLEIDGLDEVENNADLQIVVGFKGSQLKNNAGALVLQGTMNLMMFIDGDKLIYNKIRDVNSTITAYLSNYPTENRFLRNKSKAMILTSEVQKDLKELSVLFTGSSKIGLYFGEFRKVKKGKASEFNKISKPIVEEIIKNKSPEALNKAIEFWKKQLDVDFGKKLKEKRKLKVIYTNIASAYILLNDIENAKKYADLAKKNAGFFDVFMSGYKDYSKTQDFVKNYKTSEFHEVSREGNYMYEFVFKEDGEFDLGRKKRNFTKIVLEKFVAYSGSNIVSLDKGRSPTAKLFVDEEPTYFYTCDDKVKIVLKSGKTIVFKLIKGDYVPFYKVENGDDIRLY
ncbi:hypothetical protein H3Z83_10985 [Tenacibaculum sp. S7007]|uniref:Uncharacterized protein n=1 Tax=Tenacibaculum pelagium TaxID=2759527 RepID=A0A839APM2_9FLAO|nr:hypothetical protein [Tenacibaculum pelagium]MBA6157043.1 hypothetical protein [Tenacibaculum pelagium]